MSQGAHDGIGLTSARTRERLIARLRQSGIESEIVLDRIRSVPRHVFVDEALAGRAYEDTALPIGFNQTISQPYIVALMTWALIGDIAPGEKLDRVLEVGPGCGYQSAVLAPFVRHLYGIERISPLIRRAQTTLSELGVSNVSIRYGDGWQGWPSQGPYQGILVAAAADEVPAPLLQQLADKGRLIIPVGPPSRQHLLCIARHGDDFETHKLTPVNFVPLVKGTHA